MPDPVRPVAPREEIERIYRKAQSAALDWKLQSDESCDLIDNLLVACEAYFAAAPVPCAASPADRQSDSDDDIPIETRRELMHCATRNGTISYYYLCDIFRRGRRAGVAVASITAMWTAAANVAHNDGALSLGNAEPVEPPRATGKGARDADTELEGRGDRDRPVRAVVPDSQGQPPVAVALDPHRLPWRCFHCDEVFTDKAEAHEHFGEYLDDSPLCLIKGQDGGLAARVRELEAEVMEVCKQRNEYENDARLYHELSEEVRRRTNGHGLYMHLDYVEGEKLVLQEKVATLEAELARLRGEATVRPVNRCKECGGEVRAVKTAMGQMYRCEPCQSDWFPAAVRVEE